ncbi:MAG: hypothetical protein HY720_18460 [Planctomycetes bacterium]|nr:hypothetical protein [Planctomycetota bacterium]
MNIEATQGLNLAIAQPKSDPTRPVRVRLEGMEIEIRAVEEAAAPIPSAAEVFASLGPWAGETADELKDILGKTRRRTAPRPVGDL